MLRILELPLAMQRENVGVMLMLDTRNGKVLLVVSPKSIAGGVRLRYFSASDLDSKQGLN